MMFRKKKKRMTTEEMLAEMKDVVDEVKKKE